MRLAQERKYSILKRILDGYVRDGVKIGRRTKLYDTSTEEKANHARSRAFIHLYLASAYGMMDFEERERSITDASNDGGIDAYFIDTGSRVIDVIQSKFRVGSSNFESKIIQPEEIMAIDLDRIMEGNTHDIGGKEYNGHILAFIDKIKAIPDIARYRTKVTILANVKFEQYPLVERLFSGDIVNVVNFDRCYGELVLPTLRGEQHYTASMRLQLDLSNKSTSQLSAEIQTAHGPSQVKVVFVPTIEIARIIRKYKNSILRYNPRSYLDFKEQRTNEGIKGSIVDIETGEFAILNNGITIVSDETYINPRVGTKGKAQLEIVNPQIINGGQTAFTLAKVYEETKPEKREKMFLGKEVMLRIITLPALDEQARKDLILNISSATNSQTAVSSIDRSASNDDNREIAEAVFKRLGFLYEPKRGEYHDALRLKYIGEEEVIERSLFTRIAHIAHGKYAVGVAKKMMRNTGGILPALDEPAIIDEFNELYEIYAMVSRKTRMGSADRIVNDLSFAVFVRALCKRRAVDGATTYLPVVIDEAKGLWSDFEAWAKTSVSGMLVSRMDARTGEKSMRFSITGWKRSGRFPSDAQDYVKLLEPVPNQEEVAISALKPLRVDGTPSQLSPQHPQK